MKSNSVPFPAGMEELLVSTDTSTATCGRSQPMRAAEAQETRVNPGLGSSWLLEYKEQISRQIQREALCRKKKYTRYEWKEGLHPGARCPSGWDSQAVRTGLKRARD